MSFYKEHRHVDVANAPGNVRTILLNHTGVGSSVVYWNNMTDSNLTTVTANGGPAPFLGPITGTAAGPSYFSTLADSASVGQVYYIWDVNDTGRWESFVASEIQIGGPGRRWTTSGLQNDYPVTSVVSDYPPLYDVYRIEVHGFGEATKLYWIGLCNSPAVTPATLQSAAVFYRQVSLKGTLLTLDAVIDVPARVQPCLSLFYMKSSAFSAEDSGTTIRIYRANKMTASFSKVDV